MKQAGSGTRTGALVQAVISWVVDAWRAARARPGPRRRSGGAPGTSAARVSSVASLAVLALLASFALVGTVSAPPAAAVVAERVKPAGPRVASPDGRLALNISVAGGQLAYTVARGTRQLVQSSALGLILADGSTLGADVEIAGTRTKKNDSTWEPVWGPDASVRDHYRELTVALRQGDGRVFDVIVRAYDDGIAFRYRIPVQPGLATLGIVDEATEFALAGDPTAWWTERSWESAGDENPQQSTPYSQMGASNLPATFRYADGTHLSIHEADLVDYAAMTIVPESGRLHAALVPTPGRAAAVVTTAGRTTPWRTLTITRDAAGLIESHLLENLNPPCALCDQDTSWIKPTKYVGIWWVLQHGQFTWAEGENHGATTARAKEYIDFAAAHSIHGLLTEGWNVGWDGSWADQDFTTSTPDFDLEEVVAYGKSKGVEFVAHNETGAGVENYEKQIDAAFALYEKLGIHYLKTGYVGKIDGHNQYDQGMVNHYRFVLEKAAEHHINVICHECVHGSGEVRTYPNALAREAVRGQEYDAFSEGNSPEHTLVLPFTRMLSGPMDYTPGIMDILWDPQNAGRRGHTTVAKQLSYYVNYFSGVQMAADLPEHYAGTPGLKFIEDVPARWDETRVLSATVGDHLVTARRSGHEWFVGAMTGEQAQTLRYPLSFLGHGRWVAEAYTDAQATDYRTNPTALAVNSTIVTSKSAFVAALERSGGQAVRFRPASAADVAGLPRYVEPRLKVVSIDAPASVEDGDFATVTANIANPGSVPGGQLLAMQVNGAPIEQTRNVRVDADGTATVTFQVRLTGGPSALITIGGMNVIVPVDAPADAVPAPTGLTVTSFAGSHVALTWQPVEGASYQVFRRDADGVYGPSPLAEVPADTTTYVDTTVTPSRTYGYVVRAVAGRVSVPSSEVLQESTPQIVQVTWRVRVPADTPEADTVFLPGALPAMGPWDPGKVAMTRVAAGIWETTLPVMEGTTVEYKYTRGSWETVESWGEILGPVNRRVTITAGPDGTQLVDDTSVDPATPDSHEAVGAWFDLP